MSGLKNQKALTVEFNLLPANVGTFKTELTATTMSYWQFLFPDGSSVKSLFGISDFSPGDATPDGKLTGSMGSRDDLFTTPVEMTFAPMVEGPENCSMLDVDGLY